MFICGVKMEINFPLEKKDYNEFLNQKRIIFKSQGIEFDDNEINKQLFPFQRDLVKYALRKGRSAIFADTGLFKSGMLAEWSRIMIKHTGSKVLVVSPLSVAHQTIELVKRTLDIDIVYSNDGQSKNDITITNYEHIKKFNPDDYIGVVLDESSILKSLDGKYKNTLIEMFSETPYRLCCTATPAPNDIAEIANHSEFLGIMSRSDMLSTFFVHDNDGWRLRHYGIEKFYKWLASWGMSIKKPSDLGYENDGFILPELTVNPIFVKSNYTRDNELYTTKLHGISERAKVRKLTHKVRCNEAAKLINGSGEQWIVWCGLNPEAALMKKLIPDCVEVKGSDKVEFKRHAFKNFVDGKIQVLVTKPKIAGFGMNFQNSSNAVFVGLSDSWETYYQCIRRQYRFGQDQPVNVYIVLSDIERQIFNNVMRKERKALEMSDKLIKNVQQYEKEEIENLDDKIEFVYSEDETRSDDWTMKLGDSVERMNELADNSIDLSVYSPPFNDLYVYSATERDLGNSVSLDDFMQHFGYIIDELLRATKPGRVTACHVMDLPAMLGRDGWIGLKDFSGEVIREFTKRGWIYDARIPIDKNQQMQSIRTHSKALTMTQMNKDRSWLRPALPDYILKFRKPGGNEIPVNGQMTGDNWIELANPIWNDDRCMDGGALETWYGIKETDVLNNYTQARSDKDQRHICPLQLETIKRCIWLWSNPGELVFDPFAGIGSTGYVALCGKGTSKNRMNGYTALNEPRKFIGIELKPEYYELAVKNLKSINEGGQPMSLF